MQQNPENQLIELRKWAKDAGHEVVGEFVDEISSKDQRPQKEKVLGLLRLGTINGACFWSLDRWGRTMSELVLEIEEFACNPKRQVFLFSLKEQLDLTTAAGRLSAHMWAALANFERDRIQERTLLGLSRARKEGKVLGRHPVNCGCGTIDKRGNKHDGYMKPVRDEHNQVIGWKDERNQTPQDNPLKILPKDTQNIQTDV